MNDRLQELVDRSFRDEQGERFDPEYLAQLIVRDCVRVARAGVAPAVAQAICERFGVEE
jgi:hypothetical protein